MRVGVVIHMTIPSAPCLSFSSSLHHHSLRSSLSKLSSSPWLKPWLGSRTRMWLIPQPYYQLIFILGVHDNYFLDKYDMQISPKNAIYLLFHSYINIIKTHLIKTRILNIFVERICRFQLICNMKATNLKEIYFYFVV